VNDPAQARRPRTDPRRPTRATPPAIPVNPRANPARSKGAIIRVRRLQFAHSEPLKTPSREEVLAGSCTPRRRAGERTVRRRPDATCEASDSRSRVGSHGRTRRLAWPAGRDLPARDTEAADLPAISGWPSAAESTPSDPRHVAPPANQRIPRRTPSSTTSTSVCATLGPIVPTATVNTATVRQSPPCRFPVQHHPASETSSQTSYQSPLTTVSIHEVFVMSCNCTRRAFTKIRRQPRGLYQQRHTGAVRQCRSQRTSAGVESRAPTWKWAARTARPRWVSEGNAVLAGRVCSSTSSGRLSRKPTCRSSENREQEVENRGRHTQRSTSGALRAEDFHAPAEPGGDVVVTVSRAGSCENVARGRGRLHATDAPRSHRHPVSASGQSFGFANGLPTACRSQETKLTSPRRLEPSPGRRKELQRTRRGRAADTGDERRAPEPDRVRARRSVCPLFRGCIDGQLRIRSGCGAYEHD